LSTSKEPKPKAFDKVIYTLPGERLPTMTNGKLSIASDMQSVSIMTVNLWYPQENLNPPGFGYLIPRDAHNPENALGVFFDSSVVERGPDEPAGTKLFVLMGGHYFEQPGATIPTRDEAIEQAKTVLERHMGIPKDTPCFAMANLAQDCIPQPRVNHKYLLDALDEQVKEHFEKSLTLVGGSYGDIGAMGALGSAWSALHHLSIETTWGYTGIHPRPRYWLLPQPLLERPRKHPNERKSK
jgi:oxygen-dependent protoporphyrinogen oxidase